MSKLASERLAVIILAAGEASRMGRPKQLLPWKNTTLLGNAINLAKSLTPDVLIVLGAHADQIKQHGLNTDFVTNEDWQSGMGSSLAYGVKQCTDRYEPAHILVMVVDQPLLGIEHYKHLWTLQLLSTNKIIASSYAKGAGVPAIFPKQFFESLMTLNADFGARKLMKAHKHSLVTVENKGETLDLDTPPDYESAFSRWGR